jgi:hypothetical protein
LSARGQDQALGASRLTRAFGFAETMRTTTPNGGTHGEMTLDGQRIMMGQGQSWRAPATLATGQQ